MKWAPKWAWLALLLGLHSPACGPAPTQAGNVNTARFGQVTRFTATFIQPGNANARTLTALDYNKSTGRLTRILSTATVTPVVLSGGTAEPAASTRATLDKLLAGIDFDALLNSYTPLNLADASAATAMTLTFYTARAGKTVAIDSRARASWPEPLPALYDQSITLGAAAP